MTFRFGKFKALEQICSTWMLSSHCLSSTLTGSVNFLILHLCILAIRKGNQRLLLMKLTPSGKTTLGASWPCVCGCYSTGTTLLFFWQNKLFNGWTNWNCVQPESSKLCCVHSLHFESYPQILLVAFCLSFVLLKKIWAEIAGVVHIWTGQADRARTYFSPNLVQQNRRSMQMRWSLLWRSTYRERPSETKSSFCLENWQTENVDLIECCSI